MALRRAVSRQLKLSNNTEFRMEYGYIASYWRIVESEFKKWKKKTYYGIVHGDHDKPNRLSYANKIPNDGKGKIEYTTDKLAGELRGIQRLRQFGFIVKKNMRCVK